MSKWKSFSFLKPVGHVEEIGGEELTFYPVSIKMAFRLQSIAGPVAEALSVLMTRRDSDTSSTIVPGKDGVAQSIHVDAIPTDTAALRTKERRQAVRQAVDTLLNPKNVEVLASLLGDSLRDVFPRDAKMAEKVEFVESLPVGVAAQMVVAFVEANKRVFGPLADRVEELVQKGLSAAQEEQEIEDQE